MNRRTSELQGGYVPPAITDHGSLQELTQAIELRHVASIATMGIQFAATVIGKPPITVPDPNLPDPNIPFLPDQPNTPSGGGGGGGGVGGGGGGGVVPNTPLDPGTAVAAGEPVSTGTNHVASTPTTATGGVSGGGAGVSSGGGGGSLPFTGYALALVAGLGMLMAAAGRMLHRFARR